MKQLTDSLQEKFGEFADRCAKFARDVLSFKGFFGKVFALVVVVVISVMVVGFLVVWQHFSYVVTRLCIPFKLCCMSVCKLFKLCGDALEALEAQHQAEAEEQNQRKAEEQNQPKVEEQNEVRDSKSQKQPKAGVKDIKPQKQLKAKARISKN